MYDVGIYPIDTMVTYLLIIQLDGYMLIQSERRKICESNTFVQSHGYSRIMKRRRNVLVYDNKINDMIRYLYYSYITCIIITILSVRCSSNRLHNGGLFTRHTTKWTTQYNDKVHYILLSYKISKVVVVVTMVGSRGNVKSVQLQSLHSGQSVEF